MARTKTPLVQNLPREDLLAGEGKPLLLAALAQALSGENLLVGADGLFPNTNTGKQTADAAIERGLLSKRVETIPPRTKKSKPKEQVFGSLTEKGRHYLLNADSPKGVLEALLPVVQGLAEQRSPGTDIEAFRQEVEQATKTCTETIRDAYAHLQSAIESALQELRGDLLAALPSTNSIEPGLVLATLQDALSRVGGSAVPPSPSPSPNVQAPAVPPQQSPGGTNSLRTALHEGYKELCLYKEFQDRLVEIPRLYHETANRFPGLTVDAFHRELETLNRERTAELKVLNEVTLAKERHLAIDKDGRLYYYLFWK